MTKIDTLIVDDNEIDRFILKRNLKSTEMDLEVSEIENGASALELVTQRIEEKQGLPNLIFLDINMPIMGGFEFLEKFQELLVAKDLEPCKVLMYSHSLHPGDQERANQYSFVHYREKSSLDGEALKSIIGATHQS